MKQTLLALALASLAAGAFAESRHPNALTSEQHSVARQQVADAEEWLRSRHRGTEDADRGANG